MVESINSDNHPRFRDVAEAAGFNIDKGAKTPEEWTAEGLAVLDDFIHRPESLIPEDPTAPSSEQG